MTQDLLQLISNEMKGFSKGQKRIGAFILEHYDKAAFMTAAKLGETVGVSESTVVRFAAELGFEGYPQLQKSLQDIIRNRLTTVQRMEIIDEQLSGGVDVKTVQEVLGHENLNTTQIYTHIESTELKIAAEANPLSKLDFSDKMEDNVESNQ